MDAIRPNCIQTNRSGEVGSILNIGSVELVNELQKIKKNRNWAYRYLLHVMLFMGLKPCFLFR
jgi:hypothetical protein